MRLGSPTHRSRPYDGIRSRLSLQRSDMSIAARHIQSQRSRGAQCGTVAHEPVGVGLPNPLGRGNQAPTIRFCLSLQRSDMSIAARHLQSQRSRGAQCALCLNHGLHGLHGGRNCLNQDTQDLRIYRIKGGKPRRHGTGKRGSSLAYYRIK